MYKLNFICIIEEENTQDGGDSMSEYKPSFTLSNEILLYVSSISEKIGRITAINHLKLKPHLRKNNRIRSIRSSLKIEANSLSFNQVRDVIKGKIVLGEQKEIQEVKNAYKAYERILEIDPYNIEHLKMFHEIMTKYVVEDSGDFRKGEDGNGRMARLWHTAILSPWKPIFEYIPIESQIEKFQEDYYDAIAKCHEARESTIFIEFMLSQIDKILDDIAIQFHDENEYLPESIKMLLSVMEYDVPYTSKALMEKLGLKSREGFRRNYLQPAIERNLVYMTIPDKPNSKNQRYVKV